MRISTLRAGLMFAVWLALVGCKGGGASAAFDASRSELNLPATTPAGWVDFSAVLRDANGNPLEGVEVEVSVTGEGATFEGGRPVSNGSGGVNGRLTAQKTGEVTLVLKVSGGELRGTVTVVPGPVSGPRFFSQPSHSRAGEPIAPPVVVEIVDGYGNRTTEPFAAYVRLTWSNQGNPLLNGGSATMPIAADGGVIVFDTLIVTRPQVGYALRVEAPDTSVADESVKFDVSLGEPYPGLSTLTATPPNGVAGGAAVSLTLTVADRGGNALEGVEATFNVSGTGNTLSASQATTAADGTASVTLSSTVAETKTVTAQVGDAGVTATVTFIQ